MTQQFTIIDNRDLKNLRKFYRKAPAKFGQVMNATLNTLAFTTRLNITRVLPQVFEIRDPRFMRGSVKVQKARGGNHRSIVGSIERKRHTGWEEQQTGKKSDSNRVPTLAARLGNFRRKMAGKARLKRNLNPLKIQDIKKGTRKSKTIALMKQAKKQKRPFIIKRRDVNKVRVNKRMAPGLYQFKGRRLLRTQTFGKAHDPKRVDWMGKALKRTQRSTDFRRVFADEFVRLAKKLGVRVV